MTKKKLYLIDGHGLCYRSFYAIRELTTSKGQATNAVYGYINTLKKILRKFEPDYLAVCFDSKEKTKRQQQFADYKIHRPKMPDPLREQIPIIKQATQHYALSIFEKPGYEADDIIATLSEKFVKKGFDVVIITEDKDMFQLATPAVQFYSPRKDALYGLKDVHQKLGFDPALIVDYIALAGDKSDNIPGVRGVGDVSAKKLIEKYGSLESIFEHIDDIEPAGLKEKLIADQDNARLSKELAILDLKVPVDIETDTLQVQSPDMDKLFALYQDLEFRKWAQEIVPKKKAAETALKVQVLKSTADMSNVIKNIKKNDILFFHYVQPESQGDFFEARSEDILFGCADQLYQIAHDDVTSLQSVFENPDIDKVVYDLRSMRVWLQPFQIKLKGFVFDIHLAGYLLSPVQSAIQIQDLAWNYLGTQAPKEKLAVWECAMLMRLYPLLKSELDEKSLFDLLRDIEIPLTDVLFRMEAQGVNLDLDFLEGLSKQCQQMIDGLTKQLYKMADAEFNLNSPKQLSQILFEKLKLPVIKKTKTGFSTNEEVLTTLAKQHDFPELILEYRQITKLKSTYIDALPKLVSSQTGRLHAEFLQTGTETGRLSSRHPNLQNIPIRTELGRKIRKAIIPSQKDFLMVSADYSQIELRILAHLAKDEGLIKAFSKDQDIHQYTASLIFDVDEKDVTKEMRMAAKRVNFGIIYGMSAFGLAKDLDVSQREAQDFIDRYFLRYPKVKGFMDEQIAFCEENGYVATLLNRRRYLPEIHSRNGSVKQFAQRQAINTPVQGSAADLIKLAMVKIDAALQSSDLTARMLITVHDELVFEMAKNEEAPLIQLIRQHMCQAMELSVPIKISVKVGKNWLEMKEVD